MRDKEEECPLCHEVKDWSYELQRCKVCDLHMAKTKKVTVSIGKNAHKPWTMGELLEDVTQMLIYGMSEESGKPRCILEDVVVDIQSGSVTMYYHDNL